MRVGAAVCLRDCFCGAGSVDVADEDAAALLGAVRSQQAILGREMSIATDNRCVMARPKPLAPPVTKATLDARRPAADMLAKRRRSGELAELEPEAGRCTSKLAANTMPTSRQDKRRT